MNVQKKNDTRIILAIFSQFIILTLQYFILTLYPNLSDSQSNVLEIVSFSLVGVFFFAALKAVLTRLTIKIILQVFIPTTVLLLNYVFFRSNMIYLNSYLLIFFLTVLPTFVYTSLIKDFAIFIRIIYKTSYFVMVMGILIGFIRVLNGSFNDIEYSMPLAYYLLLPTLVFSFEFFTKYKIRHLLFVIICIVLIILFGSRGPLFSILVFVCFLLIGNLFNRGKITRILSFVSLSVIAISTIFYANIIEYIYFYSTSRGIYSRTIDLMFQNLFSLSGREGLYHRIIDSILDKPFFGYGLFGDRAILGGTYSHNVFLEVLINFGVPFGLTIILLFFSRIFYMVFIKRSKYVYIFLMWIAIGFIPLLFSASYLTNLNFWILLGLMFNPNLKEKMRISE